MYHGDCCPFIAIGQVIMQLDSLRDSSLLGWIAFAMKLVSQLERLKKDCQSAESHALIHDITQKLQGHYQNTIFIKKFTARTRFQRLATLRGMPCQSQQLY
jgi:hypothetical protein